MNALDLIKEQVKTLEPYSLRDYEYDIKLNQNENPFGFPAELAERVWERIRTMDLARYPDFNLTQITQRLADHLRMEKEGLLVGNGSNELIQVTLMTTLSTGDRFLLPVPTFALYRLIGVILGAEPIQVNLNQEDFSLPTDRILETAGEMSPKVIVLCSPNNPTGLPCPEADVRRIIEEAGALVIIDEAYYQFSDQDFRPLLDDYHNVVIMRTFSKAMALAGARVGYLMGRPSLVEQIAKAKLPYGLNVMSEAMASVALDHYDLLEEYVRELRSLRDQLYQDMAEIPGVHPYPSQSNFILARFDWPQGEVFEHVLADGIIIRDVSKAPMLEGHLRISVGTSQENQAFVRSLRGLAERKGAK
jgi:histidinol-phosphate aminotransferase